MLAPVHEPRVEAERDVVQEEPVADAADVDPSLLAVEGREDSDRIVAVEPDVPGEVIAGPERDADERNVLLDRHLGHRSQRAVSACHSEGLGACVPRDLRKVFPLLEEMDLDGKPTRSVNQLVRARRARSRALVDDEESLHRVRSYRRRR